MCTVLIGHEAGDHLVIRVRGRSHFDSDIDEDRDWLTSDIDVFCGAFRGNVNAYLRSTEFQFFLSDIERLSRVLKGSARFAAAEGWIEMKITGDGMTIPKLGLRLPRVVSIDYGTKVTSDAGLLVCRELDSSK